MCSLEALVEEGIKHRHGDEDQNENPFQDRIKGYGDIEFEESKSVEALRLIELKSREKWGDYDETEPNQCNLCINKKRRWRERKGDPTLNQSGDILEKLLKF